MGALHGALSVLQVGTFHAVNPRATKEHRLLDHQLYAVISERVEWGLGLRHCSFQGSFNESIQKRSQGLYFAFYQGLCSGFRECCLGFRLEGTLLGFRLRSV